MDGPLDLPLKDIHLPDPVSWWPLSPGWWIVIGLLAALAAVLVWWYRREHRRRLSAVYLARVELAGLRQRYAARHDSTELARELSALIRRLSVSAFPRRDSAGLTGQAWLDYLDQRMTDKPFSNGHGRILVEAPYRPSVDPRELEPLIDLCEAWINTVAAGVKRP